MDTASRRPRRADAEEQRICTSLQLLLYDLTKELLAGILYQTIGDYQGVNMCARFQVLHYKNRNPGSMYKTLVQEVKHACM